MEKKPEKNIPDEPEHGPEDAEDDLENTVGGRAMPTYSVIDVVDDK